MFEVDISINTTNKSKQRDSRSLDKLSTDEKTVAEFKSVHAALTKLDDRIGSKKRAYVHIPLFTNISSL